jgi:hypothetical protein
MTNTLTDQITTYFTMGQWIRAAHERHRAVHHLALVSYDRGSESSPIYGARFTITVGNTTPITEEFVAAVRAACPPETLHAIFPKAPTVYPTLEHADTEQWREFEQSTFAAAREAMAIEHPSGGHNIYDNAAALHRLDETIAGYTRSHRALAKDIGKQLGSQLHDHPHGSVWPSTAQTLAGPRLAMLRRYGAKFVASHGIPEYERKVTVKPVDEPDLPTF